MRECFIITGWCSTHTLLLICSICSSFTRKMVIWNAHECSSWSAQPSNKFLMINYEFDNWCVQKNISSWWFQPLWKILISQNRNLPQIGVTIKNTWNHQPDMLYSKFQVVRNRPSFWWHTFCLSYSNPPTHWFFLGALHEIVGFFGLTIDHTKKYL